MNLQVLHINSNTAWRGGEQQVDYIFNGQYEHTDMYLFCPEGSPLALKNAHKTKNVFTYKKRSGLDVFAAFRLKSICKKHTIQLIHLHDSHAINTYLATVFLNPVKWINGYA